MNIKAIILLVSVAIIGLSSCQKEGDKVTIDKVAALNVINASGDTLNFYQNGTRLNNTSNLYPSGILRYLTVIYGLQQYQVKKAGNPDPLVDIPLTLDASRVYTLFIAGETTDKIFLTRDTLVTDTEARVRFVNLSQAGNLDVVLGTTLNVKNRPFKSITPYIHVLRGVNTLTIYQSGNTTPLASGTLTLVGGSSYTLFTKGVLNGTGTNAFGVRTISAQ